MKNHCFFNLYYIAVSKDSFVFIVQQMELNFTCKVKLPKRRNPKMLPSRFLHLVSHRLLSLVVFYLLHLYY